MKMKKTKIIVVPGNPVSEYRGKSAGISQYEA